MVSERSLFLHFLRIFSALIVCVGHTKEFLFVHMDDAVHFLEKLTRLFLGLGPAAVLVFFFLSGYLVGGSVIRSLIKQDLNFGTYIFDRLTRLWIVLVPALLLTFGFNTFTCRDSNISLYCTADPKLASHADIPPLFSQKISDLFSNVFFLQPFKGLPWGGNGPLWSLSYEFWYYIVFFSLIVILNSFLRRNVSFRLIPHIFILFLASKILNIDWLVLGSIWVSGAGAAYFLSTDWARTFSARYQKSVALKFTLLTFFLIIPVLITVKIFPRLIAFPILILVLTLCISTMQNDHHSRINGKLQELIVRGSEFSFSLYLIHFPIIALVASQLTPINRWTMSPMGLLVLVGITFGVLLTAYAFAWLTEFNLVHLRKALMPSIRKL